MAYVTPPTFVALDPLAAAELNILGDDIVYLKGITDSVSAQGVQLKRTSDQTITTGTETPVTFQAESFDYGGWWSSGTDIIVPAGAIPSGYTTIIVMVVMRARFATNGTGVRRIRPLLNGTNFGSMTVGGISSDPTDLTITEFVEVEAGDVITMGVYHTKGSNLALEVGNCSVMRFTLGS
jgi:hypothetical protein